MIRITLPLMTISTLAYALGSAFAAEKQTVLQSNHLLSTDTCQEIASSISESSEVHYFGSVKYFEDISHWASSSTQISDCSFEPGKLEDVGIALRILSQTRTPFAVKGGGHTTNPGFSSTSGVQIAMTRFSEVVYDSVAQTATIGSGLIWDTVYQELEPHGVNVAGARVPGLGVAGFIVGGGYSWHTNQYGLTIDTVQGFELVLSNGTAINVTETSHPDLFFGLKGGMNNFGIITKFTLTTFPQSQVWGGLIEYTGDVLDQVSEATANFAANNTDPKAAIITSFNSLVSLPGVTQLIFYDGPTPPPGIFEEFLAIPSFSQDVSTRSFTYFIKSIPKPSGSRGIFNSISVTSYTLSFIESIVKEAIYWGDQLSPKTGWFISYDVEPFLPTLFTHNTTPSAYPPDRTKGVYPLNIYFAWILPDDDDDFQNAIRTSARTLQADAMAGNFSSTIVYSNYAIYDTPLVSLYGENLSRLRAIKAAVDPSNVMGLAGGFKL